MNKPKLLPCPFCDTKASYWPESKNVATNYDYNEYISCSGCGVKMGSPLSWAMENVVKKWNTRAALKEKES